MIVRRADSTADEYGDLTTEGTSEASYCEFQPYTKLRSDTSETELDQVQVETGRVFLPGSLAPPAGFDAITITDLGQTYEFEGDAEAVRNPRTGSVSHLQAEVRRVR